MKFWRVNGVYDNVSPVPACIQRNVISAAHISARAQCTSSKCAATHFPLWNDIKSYPCPEPQA